MDAERTTSVTVDVVTVRSVLLSDGWHRVVDKSFTIGPYYYMQAGAAQSGASGGDGAVGFRFKDDAGYVFSGPLSAIVASQAAS